jgi:integrase
MAKITPKTSITAKGVASARTRASAGEEGEIKDAACAGLALRMRAGKVTWTLRWKMPDPEKAARASAQALKDRLEERPPDLDTPKEGRHVRYRRWTIGDDKTAPERARERAAVVKAICRAGGDPSRQIHAWLSGVSVASQIESERKKGPESVPWEKAVQIFLDWIFEHRAEATFDDYRNILRNTPELRRFDGRLVASINDTDVRSALADIAKRSEAHAEHVQRILASMWSRLAVDFRPITGVTPGIIKDVRAPERVRQTLKEAYADESAKPPSPVEIGRVVAIARLGVFGERLSAAILLLAGTAQRRRPVAGANVNDFQSFADEELWLMRPYFRKPANKKRSQGRHLVPVVGFAAEAVRTLDRLAGDQPWMLPVARPRHAGKQPKRPHIDPSALTHALAALPGVGFGPHAFRAAFATYSRQDLGWARGDAKLILDHMEGFDPGDVTAQHYDADPELVKKRTMMKAWTDWLEARCAEAIAADPTLLDREAVAEQVYRIRYGDEAWKAAVKRSGQKPWALAA